MSVEGLVSVERLHESARRRAEFLLLNTLSGLRESARRR
jgi:hypothetical protein